MSIGPSCPEQVTTGEREMGFDPIEEVIAAYGRGEIVVITDDENR